MPVPEDFVIPPPINSKQLGVELGSTLLYSGSRFLGQQRSKVIYPDITNITANNINSGPG